KRRSSSMKATSRPGATSCVSTSPTATTPWTSSRRSTSPRMPASPMTTSHGSFPPTTVSRPSPSPTPWCARSRSPPSPNRPCSRAPAAELALDLTSAAAAPDVPRHAAKAARIGVWVPWADTDSIAWVRYALDQRQVPYTYVRDEDVRVGGLKDRVDVLIYGHVDLELAEQIQGLPKAWGPMPYKKTPQTPSHGTPAESDDITGGIGWEGVAQLQRFVEEGGLLVTLGSGSVLALEGGIVRGVRRAEGGPSLRLGQRDAATRTPGAHLRVTFARPDHPLAYGYPARTHVFRQNYPLYDAPRRWLRMAYCTSCLDGPPDRSAIVLEWGDRAGAPLVVSGQAWGEERLLGRPAILDMPVGRGHVVAFNFNPLHRDLNRGDHRLVWNAILNWQAIVGRLE